MVPDGAAPDGAARDDGRRLHPLSPVLGLMANAPRLVLPAVVLLASGPGRLLLLASVALLAIRIAAYWRTTYSVTADGLWFRTGWLQRNERVISLDRVQHVEVVRSLRHRVTGLCALKVSVAGTGSPPVVLDAVDSEEAARIHQLLELGRRLSATDSAPADVPPPPSAPLLHLGLGVLSLGGITGAAVLVMPLFLFVGWEEVGDFIDSDAAADRLQSLSLGVLAVGGLLLAAAVGAALMVLRHFDFTLSRAGADLRIDRGLLERRSSVIPLRRVQSVHLSANVVRRWVGLATIDVNLATAVENEGTGSVDNTVPVGHLRDLEPLVALFAGVDALPAADVAHPRAARRRAIVRRVLVLVLPWALVAVPFPLVAASGSMAGALVAVLSGHLWWRRLRHGADDRVLVAEAGWFVLRRTVQPWAKVQSVSLRQSPGQRALGLCHLDLHVAGAQGTTRVRDLSVAQAAALLQVAPQPTMAEVMAGEMVAASGNGR